jgi:hypothetical protein
MSRAGTLLAISGNYRDEEHFKLYHQKEGHAAK